MSEGYSLLGKSKTWRVLVAAVVLSACASVLLGLKWQVGAIAGALAMVGDCLSSFTKRRLRIEPGGMSSGLDQVPESLLPALACGLCLPLGALDIIVIVLLFFVGQVVFSRMLFAVGLRDRPY